MLLFFITTALDIKIYIQLKKNFERGTDFSKSEGMNRHLNDSYRILLAAFIVSGGYRVLNQAQVV